MVPALLKDKRHKRRKLTPNPVYLLPRKDKRGSQTPLNPAKPLRHNSRGANPVYLVLRKQRPNSLLPGNPL
jgi:hypothetical protein